MNPSSLSQKFICSTPLWTVGSHFKMALLSLLSMRITMKFYDRVFPLSHTSGQGCFLFWALCCYLVTLLLGSWLLWYSPHFWPCAFGPFLRVPSQTLETGRHAFTEPTEVWKVGFSLSWKDSGRGHAFTQLKQQLRHHFVSTCAGNYDHDYFLGLWTSQAQV